MTLTPEIRAKIAADVAQEPPLTSAQRDTLRAILRPHRIRIADRALTKEQPSDRNHRPDSRPAS